MPVHLPDMPSLPAPAPRLRWTYTLHLSHENLATLSERCLTNPALSMRVRPSGYEDRPHLVKLTARGDAADSLELLRKLDVDLQRHRIS